MGKKFSFDKISFKDVNDKINSYLQTRPTKDLVILCILIGLIIVKFVYSVGSQMNARLTTISATHAQLKKDLAILSDTQRSPLYQYNQLKAQSKVWEASRKERQKSEASIGFLEKNLLKIIGKDNFTLTDVPPVSLGTNIQRNAFRVKFKIGNLAQVRQVLEKILEGDADFQISQLRLEKSWDEILNVEFEATTVTTP
jgi:hypothetical protein